MNWTRSRLAERVTSIGRVHPLTASATAVAWGITRSLLFALLLLSVVASAQVPAAKLFKPWADLAALAKTLDGARAVPAGVDSTREAWNISDNHVTVWDGRDEKSYELSGSPRAPGDRRCSEGPHAAVAASHDPLTRAPRSDGRALTRSGPGMATSGAMLPSGFGAHIHTFTPGDD